MQYRDSRVFSFSEPLECVMRFLPKIPFGGVALFLGAGLSACSTDTASQARPAMATEAEFEVAMEGVVQLGPLGNG